MTYSHYRNYRTNRLGRMPVRNLPTRIAYPILGTVLSVDWNTSKEDRELNEFRYKVARIEAKLRAAEVQRDIYHRVTKWPVHVKNQYDYTCGKPTWGYTSYDWSGPVGDNNGMTWQERFETIQSEWQRVKDESDGNVDRYGHGGNLGKRKAQSEFEFMNTGDGYLKFLREMAEGIRKEFFQEFFTGCENIDVALSRENRKTYSISHSLASKIEKLEEKSRIPYRAEIKVPFLNYDPTSDINDLRTLNKEFKDAKQDRDFFFEAFGCDYDKNTLACSFENSVDSIKESNPYLEKRLAWESNLEEVQNTFDKLESEVANLKQELAILGTEEEFMKIQDQRDIEFRKKEEHKRALKNSIEDRQQSVIDVAEFHRAQLKMANIVETRKGHGQYAGSGSEKHAHLTPEEAMDALTAQWKQKGRVLEIYKIEVKIPYTKWSVESRCRKSWNLSRNFWFLRKFRAQN